jgi:hypothetical protein
VTVAIEDDQLFCPPDHPCGRDGGTEHSVASQVASDIEQDPLGVL